MSEIIELGDIFITVTRKSVKNVHLTVHPPEGRVTLVAPTGTRLEVARAYAISKLNWIRAQQQQLHAQVREAPRQLVDRETHYVWGRRYLMTVIERDERPSVKLEPQKITLYVRPGSTKDKRAQVLGDWHRKLLHEFVNPVIKKWEQKLQVRVSGYFLQRMKTKWGSCNHRAKNIRLNTELVKKPKDLVEYVIVHEMAHLIEPTHNERFISILEDNFPHWREARAELNELPIA